MVLLLLSVPAAASEVTIWFAGADAPTQQYAATVVSEFMKAHPDIRVRYELIAWQGMDERIATAVAGNQAPDIMEMGNVRIAPFVEMGALEDLSRYVQSWDKRDDIPETAWVNSGGHINGVDYAIPYVLATRPLFYNRDIFANSGLDPDNGPGTWDEWIAAAEKTHNPGRGISGVAIGGNDNMTLAYLWLPQLIWQNGGDVFSPDQTHAVFNRPEGVEALEFLVSLSKFAQRGFLGMMGGDADQMFFQGRAATKTMGSTNVVSIPQLYPNLDFQMVAPPKKKQRATLAGENSLVMFKQSQQKDAAWKLIDFLVSQENQVRLALTFGYTPALATAMSDPRLDGPSWRAAFGSAAVAYGPPTTTEWARVRPRLGEEIHYALRGQKTAQQALDDAARFADQVLAEQ